MNRAILVSRDGRIKVSILHRTHKAKKIEKKSLKNCCNLENVA